MRDTAHPRLGELVARAAKRSPPRVAIVHPCDVPALQAAAAILAEGIARPVLVGARERIASAAGAAAVDLAAFEVIDVAAVGSDDAAADARAAAGRAAELARDGAVDVLMKGSLHTDELMSAVVRREAHLRTERRISHAFVFDVPRYPKLLALADCVVNIAPDLRTKRDILVNATELLRHALGVARPHVAIVAAVEVVNPQIPATVDAAALAEEASRGDFGDMIVEGPLGFDNAISAEAAQTKGLHSRVAGDVDLLVVPDLNAGNLLYKSFVYVGGAECAGIVLGARVPIVLTSRADSLVARVASVALASLFVSAALRS